MSAMISSFECVCICVVENPRLLHGAERISRLVAERPVGRAARKRSTEIVFRC